MKEQIYKEIWPPLNNFICKIWITDKEILFTAEETAEMKSVNPQNCNYNTLSIRGN